MPKSQKSRWWLPKCRKKWRSSGTLVIEGDETRLEAVMGPLADVAAGTLHGPEVILGRTQKGKVYTCLHTFYTNHSMSHTTSGPLNAVTLSVRNLLRGQHFNKANDVLFKEGEWRYSNLHLWMYDAHPIGFEDQPGGKVTVSSKRGKRGALWDADVGSGITIANDFTFTSSQKTNPATVEFMHLDGVRMRSTKALPFKEFFPLERRFRSLVNLLADCQLEIVDEIFRRDPHAFGEVASVARHWAGGFAKRDDPSRGLEPVSFSGIPDFSKTVKKWFEEHQRLERIANLYLHGKHNVYLDTMNQFLGVLQALESFHRTYHPGVYMPEDDYKKTVRKALLDAIPSTTPPSLKDRLTSAIRFGYELSLLRRLEELTDLLPKDSVFDEVRDKKFRMKTKDTRNTMTHQISDPDNPPMYGANSTRRLCAGAPRSHPAALGAARGDNRDCGETPEGQRRHLHSTLISRIVREKGYCDYRDNVYACRAIPS